MTSDQFEAWVTQRWAQNARKPDDRVPYDMVAALGIAGETGEVVELLKKHLRDGKHPGIDLILELGDVLHYLTVIAHSYGWGLPQIMQHNFQKLITRDEKRGRVVP